jgi:cell division septation protein DedD
MANYDRGVYEPSDEVRVFDGSEEDDDVEGSRLPLLIVLALLVLAMFGGVVWLAYTQGVARGRGETPVLTAAAGPERVAPVQGSGGNVPYQGFKIYEQPAPPDDSADNGGPAAPKAAVPEAPKPAAVAQAPVDAPKPSPAPVAPPKPAPIAAAPATKPTPVVAAPAPKPVVAAAVPKPAAPPVIKPAPAASKPNSVAALIQQANNTPAPPPAKPVPTTATAAPRQLGQAAPTPATPALVTPAPAKIAAPAVTGGSYVLQIGAYKSQGDADAAWKAYKAKHSALLSGYSSDVKQADLGDKGTWYRLRVAGFGDREVATALCERLKADGGACLLAK